MADILERFLTKVGAPDESGCLSWLASTDGSGYGRFSVDGVLVSPHRFAYERYVGEIPEGLDLDHLCRNRRCVNPDHLEPVTHAVNVLRARQAVGLDLACKRKHERNAENTYIAPDGAKRCRVCSREALRARRAAA